MTLRFTHEARGSWSDGAMFPSTRAVLGSGLYNEAGAGAAGAGAGGEPGAGVGGAAGGDGGSKGTNGSGSEEAKAAARVAELEATLAKLNKEKQDLLSESIGRKNKLREYEEAGLTAAEAAELRAFKAEQEKKEREARGAYEEQLSTEREKRAEAERKSKEREAELLSDRIEKEILWAAGGLGALPQALDKLPGGGDPQIVAVTRSLFEFDAERKEVVHRTMTNPETSKRLTVKEFFEAERTKSLANLFASPVKQGSGTPAAGDGSGRATVKISRTDPRRLEKVEAAYKAGHAVEYVA